MLKQILLAATALTIVAGTTALTRAADADADTTNRVATELNSVIAKVNPGADNRSIVVEGDTGANVIVNPNPGAAANQIIPGAEVAPGAAANQIVPGAEVGPGVIAATGQGGQTVPGAEVAPGPALTGPAPAGQAAAPATTGQPAPAVGPAGTPAPGAQQALAPIHDGADLYQRLLVQGYRVVKLLQSDGSVFTVLADDLYRTDIGYVLAVDTTYGKILSLRTVSLATYGNGYGTYTAPTPNYGNTYNGYGTYAAPPAYNGYGTTYSYGNGAANTYVAPNTNTYGGNTGTYTAPRSAPSYTTPHYKEHPVGRRRSAPLRCRPTHRRRAKRRRCTSVSRMRNSSPKLSPVAAIAALSHPATFRSTPAYHA